jgi:hypothetical protein
MPRQYPAALLLVSPCKEKTPRLLAAFSSENYAGSSVCAARLAAAKVADAKQFDINHNVLSLWDSER